MAPFLFLIVAEGLSGIIESAVDKCIFKGYNILEDANRILLSHVQ